MIGVASGGVFADGERGRLSRWKMGDCLVARQGWQILRRNAGNQFSPFAARLGRVHLYRRGRQNLYFIFYGAIGRRIRAEGWRLIGHSGSRGDPHRQGKGVIQSGLKKVAAELKKGL